MKNFQHHITIKHGADPFFVYAYTKCRTALLDDDDSLSFDLVPVIDRSKAQQYLDLLMCGYFKCADLSGVIVVKSPTEIFRLHLSGKVETITPVFQESFCGEIIDATSVRKHNVMRLRGTFYRVIGIHNSAQVHEFKKNYDSIESLKMEAYNAKEK